MVLYKYVLLAFQISEVTLKLIKNFTPKAIAAILSDSCS